MDTQDDEYVLFDEEIQVNGEKEVADFCFMAKEHYIE